MRLAIIMAAVTTMQACQKHLSSPETERVPREKLLAFASKVRALHLEKQGKFKSVRPGEGTNTKAAPHGMGCYYFGTPYDDGFGKITCMTPSSEYCHDEVYDHNQFSLHENIAVTVSYLDEEQVFNQMVYLSDLKPELMESILQNGYFEVRQNDEVNKSLVEYAYEEWALPVPESPIVLNAGTYPFTVPEPSGSAETIYIMNIRYDPVNGISASIYYM